jgi:hypothetical protein
MINVNITVMDGRPFKRLTGICPERISGTSGHMMANVLNFNSVVKLPINRAISKRLEVYVFCG